MFSLIPKERVFFDLFEKAAANAHVCAKELVEFFDKFDNLPDRMRRIKELEHRGDELTHETIERLNKTFVTPLDREDIHELVCRIDDILDRVDTAVDRVCLFKIKTPMEDAKQMAHCIANSTALIVDMISHLRDMREPEEIRRKVLEVHRLENEADRIERHALADLFENQPDAVHIIKWKNIIEVLESANDKCEDVANIIEGIVLKNV
jgi:predicted phosphate transport protein (TIGR00153 family)